MLFAPVPVFQVRYIVVELLVCAFRLVGAFGFVRNVMSFPVSVYSVLLA